LEITKTTLSLILVMITILTALTTTIAAAYAGGDDDDDNNRDQNKQKAEDDSAAAIADCDDNDVEEARFLCIALATNDVEIETEPPEEEPEEGLIVCKEVENPPEGVSTTDFHFIIEGEIGIRDETQGFPPPECNFGLISFVGGYTVTEDSTGDAPPPTRVEITGDCIDNDPADEDSTTADGEVEEGEIATCTFTNIYEGGDG
jgi:hypothetical protein